MVDGPRLRKQPFGNIPVIGKWIGRIGRVIDIASTPCSPSAEMWVLAAWVGLPIMLLSAVKPSPTDFLFQRLGRGPGRHGAMGTSGGKGMKFKFDVWAIIEGEGPSTEGVYWAVFKLGSWATRTLWYFAVADEITQGVLSWTSAAYQYQGCISPGTSFANCVAQLGPFPIGNLSNGLYDQWLAQDEFGMVAGPTGIGVPPGMDPTIFYQFSWDYSGLESVANGSPNFKLVDATSGSTVDHQQITTNNFGDQQQSGRVYGLLQGTAGHVYQLAYDATQLGWINITGGHMSAYSNPDRKNVFPDP